MPRHEETWVKRGNPLDIMLASMWPRAKARGNDRGREASAHERVASMKPRAKARGNMGIGTTFQATLLLQ